MLWSKARVFYREMTNDPEVIVFKHVMVNFIKRNNIRELAKETEISLKRALGKL